MPDLPSPTTSPRLTELPVPPAAARTNRPSTSHDAGDSRSHDPAAALMPSSSAATLCEDPSSSMPSTPDGTHPARKASIQELGKLTEDKLAEGETPLARQTTVVVDPTDGRVYPTHFGRGEAVGEPLTHTATRERIIYIDFPDGDEEVRGLGVGPVCAARSSRRPQSSSLRVRPSSLITNADPSCCPVPALPSSPARPLDPAAESLQLVCVHPWTGLAALAAGARRR